MLVPVVIIYFIGACFCKTVITKYDENSLDNQVCDDCHPNPDEYLITPQIIRRHGYASESHVVETADGYLLTLHRIPANKNRKIGKQPVFLQHGLLSSSTDWVITANKSLAFMLSDLGYDVWLGNARGNTYSVGHASLLPNSAQFWNFSFHEMGVYDLPAVLNHVSNVTGKGGEIIYIGHSMGTTMFYIFSSIFPELAKNTVKMMVGLAPVAYCTHMKSPIRYFAPFVDDMEWLFKHLGIKEFLPNGKLIKFLSYDCELFNIDKKICEDVIFAFCGFDKDQFDEKLLPAILAHTPAGCSSKTIIHYAQEIHHGGDFMAFDYGTAGNLVRYGTPTPPFYNITDIEVPIFSMYADNDWLANYIDVYRFNHKLNNSIGMYEIPLKVFNHIDFLWAKDAPKLVYDKLIQVVKKYPME